MALVFWNNRVNWPIRYVDHLTALIDRADPVERSEFMALVNNEMMGILGHKLGYCDDGLTMAGDYHVTYYRTTIAGGAIHSAFFKHNGIEFVFAPWHYVKTSKHRTPIGASVPWQSR